MFRDARDSGPVLMTPIYLLLGCAGPIWVTFALVSPNRSVRGLALPAFAGLLSLGVGDAAAAYIGSRYVFASGRTGVWIRAPLPRRPWSLFFHSLFQLEPADILLLDMAAQGFLGRQRRWRAGLPERRAN